MRDVDPLWAGVPFCERGNMSINDDMFVHSHGFPVALGFVWGKDAKPYEEIEVVTRLHLHVEREDPMPYEDGTDYADYYYVDLPYEVEIEPGKKAWSIFEQAVLECMEIVHGCETGPEITNYSASLEQIRHGNWHCENFEEIENEKLVLGNNKGPEAVKKYDWFCVAVEGESCHHGNGWHSGCANCDQEENEVK